MLSECQHGVKCYTQDCWVRVDWDRGVVECDMRLGGYFCIYPDCSTRRLHFGEVKTPYMVIVKFKLAPVDFNMATPILKLT